jgi:hypothetical protein
MKNCTQKIKKKEIIRNDAVSIQVTIGKTEGVRILPELNADREKDEQVRTFGVSQDLIPTKGIGNKDSDKFPPHADTQASASKNKA